MTYNIEHGIGKDCGMSVCDQMRELFSPWLDGEISVEESHDLEGHLLTCDSCRQELDLWKKISETLRGDLIEGEPSPNFCSGVMSRLRQETGEPRSLPGRKLFTRWRAPAAAAAAAVMLFAGSWGAHVALNPEKPKTEIVINQPDPGTVIQPGTPDRTAPEKMVQPQNTDRVTDTGTPVAEPETGNTGSNSGSVAEPAPTKSLAGNQLGDVALLNSNRDILSTILKLSASNTANATAAALDMAAGMGGGGQVLTTQKNGSGDLAIIRLVVPRESGKGLAAQLSGLGGIIDRTDEKKDISASYIEAGNRLKEIQARISAGVSPGERSQLEAEASGLKRQIESWNKDLGSYVIILWVEQKG
ncbi:MAG: anti-sigma factor family protein [Bacillota bacterium]